MKSKQVNGTAVDLGTEAKIKEAAKKVFLKKGYDGTKTRDIADEAGVNLALVNYYFRSKEKLFNEVFDESAFAVARAINSIFDSDLPLEVKIYKLTEQFTELFLGQPDIPLFTVYEANRNADKMYEQVGLKDRTKSGIFEKQLEDEAAKGNIRPITRMHLEIVLVGLLSFPFMSRPVLAVNGIAGKEAFEKFVREHQKIVPEMVMTYLRKLD
ncbi:MAG: TetR/AcrR family transcriptional regulator [Lewinellaceae bacterium]|nr:TetR/AcrR family transcriptional regulator [Saprospiraceae bacterium]MCB9337947.1 TetR/AcrR family transcriptional regulator [Lewinellaceae bacterium]